MTTMEKINYHGWSNSWRLSNGRIELVVTTDVGPRLIHFGFNGGENEFATVAPLLGLTGGDEWRVYGGHRFWHAPEHPVRTYYPDNGPVALVDRGDFVRLVQDTEQSTGIQKEIDIVMHAEEARLRVVHRLINHNVWSIELAPWALSVMAPGGIGILPLPPRVPHGESLLPANTLTLWSYTNMADRRWTWGHRVIMLKQDPQNASPQKLGVASQEGWVAYANRGHLFVKFFEAVPAAVYPDLNSSVEMFTNDLILEVETLGPLASLAPGATAEHVETWILLDDVPQPENETNVVDQIFPLVEKVRK